MKYNKYEISLKNENLVFLKMKILFLIILLYILYCVKIKMGFSVLTIS